MIFKNRILNYIMTIFPSAWNPQWNALSTNELKNVYTKSLLNSDPTKPDCHCVWNFYKSLNSIKLMACEVKLLTMEVKW
jgi:hypothetical protein